MPKSLGFINAAILMEIKLSKNQYFVFRPPASTPDRAGRRRRYHNVWL